MTNAEIKLELSYSEAEYLSAARLLTLRDSNTLFRIILYSLSLAAGAAILTGLLTDFPWWAAFIIMLLFLGALFYNAIVLVPRKHFRGDPKFQDSYQFIFSDAGVAVKSSRIDSKLSWSLYTKVIEGADAFLLVYGKGIRTMTLVPKRVFRDRLQENAFRKLVARQLAESSVTPKLKTGAAEPSDEYRPTSLNPPDWR